MKIVLIRQEPAVAFAKKGYHILLEKPMAVSVLWINNNHVNKMHNLNLIKAINDPTGSTVKYLNSSLLILYIVCLKK